MSLRLRLVAAFFLLSVVPLGAVTFYSYRSSADALRAAAQHEAELLAGELGQLMQMVTTQLSERVEHLMDVQAEAQPVAVTASAAKPTTRTPTASPDVAAAKPAAAVSSSASIVTSATTD